MKITIFEIFNIIIPSEDTNILEFNQYQKSDKAPLIVYADLECIIYNVYPHKYMDDWKRFNETSLSEKEDFYSHLNMDELMHLKDFEIKNLGECHDLYV